MKYLLSLDDYEDAARRYLPRPIFGYVSGGAETNTSLNLNRTIWKDWLLKPSVLRDVSTGSLETSLLGETYDAPFGIAPMGGAAIAAYRGDTVLAKAAKAENIPSVLSAASLTPMEEVRSHSEVSWFQAYLPGNDEEISKIGKRVANAGFGTLVVTVDVPVVGNRENLIRTGFDVPLKPSLALAWDGLKRPRWLTGCFFQTLIRYGMPHYENMSDRIPLLSTTFEVQKSSGAQLTWQHMARLRDTWKGKLILKGVLAPEDVSEARKVGFDGVIASNHGGRQLDFALHPMQVLPELISQAQGMPVMLDGGVRRGTDIIKALALGAHFVFVGRPMLYAAGLGGESGVRRAIGLLKSELQRDLALLGRASVRHLDRSILVRSDQPA